MDISRVTRRHHVHRRLPIHFGVESQRTLFIVLLAVFHPVEFEGIGKNIWTSGVTAYALLSAGLIAAVEHRPPLLIRIVSIRPLTLAGKYSYGMYIYHLLIFFVLQWLWLVHLAPKFGYHPAIAFVYILCAILITTVVAAASYEFIEKPILRLKRIFPSPAASV